MTKAAEVIEITPDGLPKSFSDDGQQFQIAADPESIKSAEALTEAFLKNGFEKLSELHAQEPPEAAPSAKDRKEAFDNLKEFIASALKPTVDAIQKRGGETKIAGLSKTFDMIVSAMERDFAQKVRLLRAISATLAEYVEKLPKVP